jgi:hypothetical protein
MTDAADFEAGRELIRGNPALFSHFYTLKGSVADRYPLLDRFINYILVRLYPYFPRSLDALIHYFEGNMLLFYDDFVANAAGFADFFRDREQIGLAIKNLSLSKQMISFLTTYISVKCLADFNFRVINHLLSGEKDNLQRNVRRLNL